MSTLATTIRTLREHRRNARLTRDQLEAHKLEKFRRLVRHTVDRSPYYANVVRERGIDVPSCVPTDFPALTKSTLMANFDAIVTAKDVTKQRLEEFLHRSHDPSERYLGKYVVIHTSGSSGHVGYFVYSPEDWARGTAMRRNGQPRPRRSHRGRLRIAFYGASDGHYAGVTMMSVFSRNLLARLLLDIRIHEINRPLDDVVASLNAFQPDYLSGYTTALKILAAKQRDGTLSLSLTGIAAAGEVTTEADRALLEHAFGCGVFNMYGSSEHLGMGVALPGSPHMVLHDDELIYEIHDDHCFVTNLFNYTLPLIRYRMSDTLRPLADGSRYAPYLAIESLVGRNEMQPVFRNRDGAEDFISPHTINEIFVPGVTRFQLHVTGPTSFRFMICLDAGLDATEKSACKAAIAGRLGEILAAKRMENVGTEVVEADDLPLDPRTRKFRLIVDARQAQPAHGVQPLRDDSSIESPTGSVTET